MPAAGIESAATHAAARAMRTPRMSLSLAPAADGRCGSAVTRCAIQTGMIESDDHEQRDDVDDRLLAGRQRFAKIQIGSVCCAPAVKIVTITSSNESAKASRPPASSAVRICGNVTWRNVCHDVGAEVRRGLLERPGHAAKPRLRRCCRR